MTKLIPLLLLACATQPATHTFVKPAPPTTPIEVCWLETGGTTVPGHYASSGSSDLRTWEITSSALLVKHPSGNVLIDTGISSEAHTEANELSGWRQFIFNQTAGRNELRGRLTDLLSAHGASELKGVVLSHAHPDHAGGVGSLAAQVPVWVAAPELQFIQNDARGVVIPTQARELKKRMKAITFEAKPYALYNEQWDVFGDGSVVVVPTFGHTPGSVATFVNLSATQRLVHVGDLINVTESLTRHVGKSWLMRTLTDEDKAMTDAQVETLIALHAQDPQLVILPAHDRPAHLALFREGCIKSE